MDTTQLLQGTRKSSVDKEYGILLGESRNDYLSLSRNFASYVRFNFSFASLR